MDPLSIIGGIASVGSSILSASSAKSQADDSRRWQQQQIDRQNAYNTPAAQRARYEQAGFNPYFAMGNIANGNMTTIPSDTNAVALQQQANNYQSQAINQGANTFINLMQQRLIDANVRKAESEATVADTTAQFLSGPKTAEANAKAELDKIMAKFQDQQLELYQLYGDKKWIAELENLASNTNYQQAIKRLTNAQADKVPYEVKELSARITHEYAAAHNLDVDSYLRKQLQGYIINKMIADTAAQQYENVILQQDAQFDTHPSNKPFSNTFGNLSRFSHLKTQQLEPKLLYNENRIASTAADFATYNQFMSGLGSALNGVGGVVGTAAGIKYLRKGSAKPIKGFR